MTALPNTKQKPIEKANYLNSAPLGTTAKSQAINRAKRFHLQHIASLILPRERVSHCMRTPLSSGGVLVNKHKSGSVSFGSVQTCGSVWHCPCCSGRISEVRRQEIEEAIKEHTSKGGHVCMVTTTTRHSITDQLDDQLKLLSKARSRMLGSRACKDLKKQLGCVGTIRALELTHGDNGWHPHIHELWFYFTGDQKRKWNVEDDCRLFDLWAGSCEAVGLKRPTRKHGLKVDHYDGSADLLSSYVSKWGLDCEMTKNAFKKGKDSTSRNMWKLLEDSEMCEDSRRLFYVYANTMKGARQLFWSRGLKQLLGIGVVSDDEILNSFEDITETFDINRKAWFLVLLHGSRTKLLEVAQEGGQKATKDYILQVLIDSKIQHPDNLPDKLPPRKRLWCWSKG